MIYWQLFLSFLQIGMFSFGGGYAALPLIQEQVVTQHGFWNDAVSFMSTKWDSIVIFVVAVWLLKKKNWNPILVMVLSGFAKLAVQGVLALVGIV